MSESSGSLVTCAQHIAEELSLQRKLSANAYVIFILQISRRFDGSLGGLSCSQAEWDYIHIDDLRRPDEYTPSFMKYLGKPMSALFDRANTKEMLMLVKGCVPSALKNLSAVREMTVDGLSAKIKIINNLCEFHTG